MESLGKQLAQVEKVEAISEDVPATGPQLHPKAMPQNVIVNDKYMLHALTSMRLGNMPKHLEGEQVAAGWPPWLSSIAGDSLVGWIPRRADAFEKLSKVGQGTYSNVYKARDLESGKIVALKKVKFDNVEPESVRFMLREIKILRRLDHPNIVKLEGLVTSRMSCSLYLVFEYMEHDLTGLVTCQKAPFVEAQIKCLFKQLLLGLDHCHKSHVLHRDIKGSNLLLDGKGNLKIADFGLASFFHPDQNRPMTSRVVTLWYRPPELLLGATIYGAAVDMWSAGCILAELFAGRPIMPGRTEVEQLHKIFKLCGSPTEEYWKTSNLPHATMFKSQQPYKRCLAETYSYFPGTAVDLLEQLLAIDPAQRGSAADALQSELFRTKPFACNPSDLPKFPPSKEIDARRQSEEARRQAEKQEKFGRKLTSSGDSKQENSKSGEVEKLSQVDGVSKTLTKSKSTGFGMGENEIIEIGIRKHPGKAGSGFMGSSPVMLMEIEEDTEVCAPKSGPAPINNMAKLMNAWKHREILQFNDDGHMAPSHPVASKDLRSFSTRYLPGSRSSRGR